MYVDENSGCLIGIIGAAILIIIVFASIYMGHLLNPWIVNKLFGNKEMMFIVPSTYSYNFGNISILCIFLFLILNKLVHDDSILKWRESLINIV